MGIEYRDASSRELQLTAISHCLARPVVQHVAGGRAEERVGVRPEVGRELGGCGGGGEGWGEGRDTLGLSVNVLSVRLSVIMYLICNRCVFYLTGVYIMK